MTDESTGSPRCSACGEHVDEAYAPARCLRQSLALPPPMCVLTPPSNEPLPCSSATALVQAAMLCVRRQASVLGG